MHTVVIMKQNGIDDTGLVLYRASVFRDPNSKSSHLYVLVTDEYIKAIGYQKAMKEQGCFFVGGNILYLLLSELFDHITVMFNKIRMDDVNINDENRTLLFLRKFSRSSEAIETKVQSVIQNPRQREPEIFEIRLAGLQNNITFSRSEGQNSKMQIAIPTSYLYNRLISYMDKMKYTDIPFLDKDIRDTFLERFNELNQKVKDKKQQIEVKYALELAKERIQDLEDENADLHRKILATDEQGQLYKRSYLLLKRRYEKLTRKLETGEDADLAIEEL
jgi:hypothetical protein